MNFKQLETGKYFTIDGSDIYRKIEPMHKCKINYNSVIISGSNFPFVMVGDNMPVQMVENEIISKRFNEVMI